MSKWFIGKGPEEIVKNMEVKAAEVVKTWNEGKEEISEKLEKEFLKDFKEVVSAIVDIKTAYYMYNKRIWEMWDNCQSDIWQIRNKMDASFVEL